MGDRTAIEWAGAAWNPVRGCLRVSEGHRNCYAEPLLGPIDVGNAFDNAGSDLAVEERRPVNWLIAGGESRPVIPTGSAGYAINARAGRSHTFSSSGESGRRATKGRSTAYAQLLAGNMSARSPPAACSTAASIRSFRRDARGADLMAKPPGEPYGFKSAVLTRMLPSASSLPAAYFRAAAASTSPRKILKISTRPGAPVPALAERSSKASRETEHLTAVCPSKAGNAILPEIVSCKSWTGGKTKRMSCRVSRVCP